MTRYVTISVASLIVSATVPISALYGIPETRKVPVARLVANLERAIAADPRNIEKRINLARLHGMAFALKTQEADAAKWRPDAEEEPYYGLHPDFVPYTPRKATTAEDDARAQEHLKKAIVEYEAALALDPRNLLARLGHGWMLDQAGDKARAIAEYRRVVSEAWPIEVRAGRLLPEDRFYTHEAATYLIALLDPVADAAEIADLRDKQKTIRDMPARAITPIVIPLSDHLPARELAAPLARIAFDADGSGIRREWTWISPAAGWLVHDGDGRGAITSALQWFGNVTFWLAWNNGYEALAALDDDGDGSLTGDELRHLAIWHDRNSNGISDRGEVRPLSAHGITALSCRYTDGDRLTFAAVSPNGVRLADGRSRPSYDIMLRPAPASTLTRR